jgi:(p)ppGpp synthase/HD superfamily hydrolase
MTPTPGIDAAVERSELVRNALETAERAHAGQQRAGSDDLPFIEHPIAVAEQLAALGHDDEVLAAALLHDVVERSEIEVDEIREGFGDRVGDLVAALTEDETIEGYEERKEEHRQRVAKAGADAAAIFAADKLTNVAMLREAYALLGEDVGDELKVGLDLKIYLWEMDLEMLFDTVPDSPLCKQLSDEMVALWGDRVRLAP